MLMCLSLSPRSHVLFVHVITKVEICPLNEENEVQEVRMVFDPLTYGLTKRMSLNVICLGLGL